MRYVVALLLILGITFGAHGFKIKNKLNTAEETNLAWPDGTTVYASATATAGTSPCGETQDTAPYYPPYYGYALVPIPTPERQSPHYQQSNGPWGQMQQMQMGG